MRRSLADFLPTFAVDAPIALPPELREALIDAPAAAQVEFELSGVDPDLVRHRFILEVRGEGATVRVDGSGGVVLETASSLIPLALVTLFDLLGHDPYPPAPSSASIDITWLLEGGDPPEGVAPQGLLIGRASGYRTVFAVAEPFGHWTGIAEPGAGREVNVMSCSGATAWEILTTILLSPGDPGGEAITAPPAPSPDRTD